MEQVKAASADGKSLTCHNIFTFAIRCREQKESDRLHNVLLQVRPPQQRVRLCDDDRGADSGSPDEGHEEALEGGAQGGEAGAGGESQDTLHHAQGGKVPALFFHIEAKPLNIFFY